MHFHIGSNTPGYLPNEPSVAVSAADVYVTLADVVREYADDLDDSNAEYAEACDEDPGASVRDYVDSLLVDEGPWLRRELAAGRAVSLTVTDQDGWPRVFFAEPFDDSDGCDVE